MSEDKKNNLPDHEKKNDLSSGASSYTFEGGRMTSSYSAYTSPAEQDQASFSPQDPSAPPVFPPHDKKPENEKHIRIRYIVIVLILVVILLPAAYLISHYKCQFSSENGVVRFSLTPRKTLSVLPSTGPEASPQVSLRPGPTPTMATVPAPSYSNWDGYTVLKLTSPPVSSETLSFKDIYKKCSPAVVSVKVTSPSGTSSASGVIMSPDGYIITNQHVIASAMTITVTLSNARQYAAALVGGDDHTDIAVLKIDASNLNAAEFCDSQYVEVGDTVVAIGNPVSQTLTMTNGIISAINRNIGYKGYEMTLLQTNAAINEGNSGGALINVYGQVVGITNIKMVSSYSSIEGIGFAIPTSVINSVVDDILKNGYVAGRPSLGITYTDIPVSAIIFYRLPGGVYINDVEPTSDARNKDLRKGDIICSANGTTVTSVSSLEEIINQFAAGDKVTLNVYRNGSFFDVDVTLIDKHGGK